MRALIVTNMYPSPARPGFGRFVYDQAEALRRLPGVELEVFSFAGTGLRAGAGGAGGGGAGGGGAGDVGAYPAAAWAAARRYRHERFDVVHAHYGLSAWPALAVRATVHAVTLHGSDLAIPASRALTLAALPALDLIGVVSEDLGTRVPGWAVRRARGGMRVLPTGVDLGRFGPIDRREARVALGLDPNRRYLLFSADPARPEKRFDRASEVAGDVELLTLGAVASDQVPQYINAADAVLVTSEREGFGLAALEALACNVPVLATPHGIAPEALAGVAGTYCGPFDPELWRGELARVLADPDPRVAGRAAAERYSSVTMAERVLASWTELAGR